MDFQDSYVKKPTKNARRHRQQKLNKAIANNHIAGTANLISNMVINNLEDLNNLLGQIPLRWQTQKAEYNLLVNAFLPHLINIAVQNSESNTNNTVLISIMLFGHYSMAKALIRALSNSLEVIHSLLNAKDDSSLTTLMHAVQFGVTDVVQALKPFINKDQLKAKSSYGQGVFLMAAALGHPIILASLIDLLKNIDPQNAVAELKIFTLGNLATQEWYSALMMAAAAGHFNTTSILAQHLDEEGRNAESSVERLTALQLAARNGQALTVFVLLPHVKLFDSKLVEKKTMTPLMLAAKNGHKKVVKYLIPHLKKEGLLNEQDYLGYTALMYAEKMKHQTIVQMLLQAGAQANILSRAELLETKRETVNFSYSPKPKPKPKITTNLAGEFQGMTLTGNRRRRKMGNNATS